MNTTQLPPDLELARTSPDFDEGSVPDALLSAHEIGADTWGRLVVGSGSLTFIFEDAADDPIPLGGGDTVVIPPLRPHHVVIDGAVEFVVEFYRKPASA